MKKPSFIFSDEMSEYIVHFFSFYYTTKTTFLQGK